MNVSVSQGMVSVNDCGRDIAFYRDVPGISVPLAAPPVPLRP